MECANGRLVIGCLAHPAGIHLSRTILLAGINGWRIERLEFSKDLLSMGKITLMH
jgi:hypothetical protein